MNRFCGLGLSVWATIATIAVAASLWSPLGTTFVPAGSDPAARSIAVAFPTAQAGFARQRSDGGR